MDYFFTISGHARHLQALKSSVPPGPSTTGFAPPGRPGPSGMPPPGSVWAMLLSPSGKGCKFSPSGKGCKFSPQVINCFKNMDISLSQWQSNYFHHIGQNLQLSTINYETFFNQCKTGTFIVVFKSYFTYFINQTFCQNRWLTLGSFIWKWQKFQCLSKIC